MTDQRPEESPTARSELPAEGQLIYQSHELLRGRREVWIEHEGEIYRLRVTTAGRLYLTK